MSFFCVCRGQAGSGLCAFDDRIVVVEKWRRRVAEGVVANLPRRPSRDDILDIVCKVLRDHGA